MNRFQPESLRLQQNYHLGRNIWREQPYPSVIQKFSNENNISPSFCFILQNCVRFFLNKTWFLFLKVDTHIIAWRIFYSNLLIIFVLHLEFSLHILCINTFILEAKHFSFERTQEHIKCVRCLLSISGLR